MAAESELFDTQRLLFPAPLRLLSVLLELAGLELLRLLAMPELRVETPMREVIALEVVAERVVLIL